MSKARKIHNLRNKAPKVHHNKARCHRQAIERKMRARQAALMAADAERRKPIVKRAANKFVNSNGLILTFLRSSISSQVASWVDMGTSIGLVAVHLSSWIATPIGAILGGVVNCCINYKFTFHAKGVSVKAVALKYLLIWLGSLLLNTVGTALLADGLDRWTLLTDIGFKEVGSFAVARVVVSLLVSWFWNFLMQRSFVYKPTRFDPYAIKMVNAITLYEHRHRTRTGDAIERAVDEFVTTHDIDLEQIDAAPQVTAHSTDNNQNK